MQNTPRTVKTIKQNQIQARIPPNRGVPTRRESSDARSIKQAEFNINQQQLIAADK
ncbi:MAG: hypothetical protein KME46_07515 [Brasilonema angustatum HA4187-MV1]|nr:hypothetical protein [Brasilonema angustatum HA4187-MV1]